MAQSVISILSGLLSRPNFTVAQRLIPDDNLPSTWLLTGSVSVNKGLFLLLGLLLFSTVSFVQPPQKVTLNLKNNGLLSREFKFLERHPMDKYPNVFTAYILPGRSYAVKLKVGTVLSQVNQQEINANMRGQEAPGKPLLTVKAKDEGNTVKLVL